MPWRSATSANGKRLLKRAHEFVLTLETEKNLGNASDDLMLLLLGRRGEGAEERRTTPKRRNLSRKRRMKTRALWWEKDGHRRVGRRGASAAALAAARATGDSGGGAAAVSLRNEGKRRGRKRRAPWRQNRARVRAGAGRRQISGLSCFLPILPSAYRG